QPARLRSLRAKRVGNCNRLQCDAQPAARNPAVLEEPRNNAGERRGRNHKNLTARTEGRNSKRRAVRVEDRAAFFAVGKANVREQALLDAPATSAVPFGADVVQNSK